MIRAARDIPRNVPIDSSQGVLATRDWAQFMIQRLSVLSSSELLSIASSSNGNIASGILGGIDKNGDAWVNSVTISYPTDVSASTGLSCVGCQSYRARGRYSILLSREGPEIAMEFSHDTKSSRAITERESWNHGTVNSEEFDRFKALRLVELTIMYHFPKIDVGGPID